MIDANRRASRKDGRRDTVRVYDDFEAAGCHPPLGQEATQEARRSLREGGYGRASVVDTGEHDTWRSPGIRRAVAVSSAMKPSELVSELPNPLMVKVLIQEPKQSAFYAKVNLSTQWGCRRQFFNSKKTPISEGREPSWRERCGKLRKLPIDCTSELGTTGEVTNAGRQEEPTGR